jgi:hypothetical protein
MNFLTSFRTTHKVKTQQVARKRGQWCGDIELTGYLANAAGPQGKNGDIVLMKLESKTWVHFIFQTTRALNIDKMPKNLCGPHLHTQIHAYLATNINKKETV